MAMFIMECGVPGSGKSYFAEQVVFSCPRYVHISSDIIRRVLWGDEIDQREPKKVFEKMCEYTLFWLKAGYNVIYDATNLKAKYRTDILNKVKELEGIDTTCIVFDIPLDVCIQRAAARERKVSEEVIRKMYVGMERPQYTEGWNYIYSAAPKKGEEDEAE